ncbi:hypothetical protein LWI28_014935 [Acer negundo]|uniref:Uncharacterized protein n=1 Tax=Acer negundo TaxID=4023 RepID=A0AAD5IQF8_ACENE|nr:hypothetical protein LWI28_014935 [Acer negundo]
MLRVTFSEAMVLPNKTDWTPSKIIAICSNKSEATTPLKCREVELFFGIPLNASNVFTFLASLRIAQEQIRMIPEVAVIFIEAKVSFSRIVKFLEAPELENTNTRQIKSDNKMDWSIWIMSSEILVGRLFFIEGYIEEH